MLAQDVFHHNLYFDEPHHNLLFPPKRALFLDKKAIAGKLIGIVGFNGYHVFDVTNRMWVSAVEALSLP